MSATVPIKAVAMPLWLRLQTAVMEASNVPCGGADGDLWTSELPEEREAATYRCTGCPVVEMCSRYAEAAREKFGVWAGIDRTNRQGRPAKERKQP